MDKYKKIVLLYLQNSVEIFFIALGLSEPWSVKEVVFDKERLQLDVYLGFIFSR